MEYAEIIETQGVKIPFDPKIITPKIERPMRNNRYEGGECKTLRGILKPGDRVLEFGSGVGLCSAVAGAAPGVERVITVEANPDLIPLITETHRLNKIKNVEILNGVVAKDSQMTQDFYIRPDFWASSMEPDSRKYSRKETLPAYSIHSLIAELNPTVIVCDIEGGELGLFDDADLSKVREIVLELHPKVYGKEGLARIMGALAAKGFDLAEDNKEGSSVQLFERKSGVLEPRIGSSMPARKYKTWPIKTPRVFVATCMKNEGPYILEWLAWHRAVGVTDFVVFTNDCDDGTVELLDKLHDLGEVTHIPNPALATDSTSLQPAALNYSHHLRQFREADFMISMDVDEFINVRIGDGKLSDLFEATGAFDVLSMTELNHGSNGQKNFDPRWVTEQFPGHESETPGNWRARHGIKSIVRLSDRVEKIRNHRPDFCDTAEPVLWLDGSGRYTPIFEEDRSENGFDCRGTFDFVSLEHYPLKSVDSYLIKMARGDVVVAKKKVSQAYWRRRNRSSEFTSTYPKQMAMAKEYHDECFAPEKDLMKIHKKCCTAHTTKAKRLKTIPEFVERRDWIMSEAWHHD
jgi:FkbM family methyltransferase